MAQPFQLTQEGATLVITGEAEKDIRPIHFYALLDINLQLSWRNMADGHSKPEGLIDCYVELKFSPGISHAQLQQQYESGARGFLVFCAPVLILA